MPSIFHSILVLSLSLLTFALPQPQPHPPPPRRLTALKPGYFLLAGDSTTATQSSDGGGWGDGFLNYTLRAGSSGHNYGHNGATTASFRSGGDWDRVIADAKNHTADYTVYITIQFGHNDQKNTSGVTLEQYTTNLETFANEATAAGAIPILVTPLTRRSYTGTPPTIVENLATQRNLTLTAAHATRSRHIDLNGASTRYCNLIGPDAAWKYNLDATDHTHLDVWGSVVFGRMVSDLLAMGYVDIAAVTQANRTLSMEIRKGVPA